MNKEKQWLEERRKGIGGSDSPAILGVSPYRTALDVWMEKRGLVEGQTETAPMRRGKMLEPLIGQMFTEQTGIQFTKPELMVHPEHSFLLASMDGIAADGKTLIEIKCPGLSQFVKARREGIPEAWQIQGNHYAAFGLKRMIFVVFNAELWELFYVEQEADSELQSIIIEEDRKFWQKVESGEIIEVESRPTLDLPPTKPGEVVQISTPEWLNAAHELREAQEILKEAKELEDGAKAEIIRLMGDSTAAEGAGLRAYHRVQNGRTTINTKLLKAEHPEIQWERYEKKGEPFRSFRPYFTDDKQGV